MSDAVVPHPTEPRAPRMRSLPGRWLGRAVDSDLFYSFRRSRITMIATVVTALFFLLAIFAPLIAVQNPFDPAQLQLMNSRIAPLWTADGQSPFLLGTDEQGRDVFSAILYGLRISLTVGVLGVVFSGQLGRDLHQLHGHDVQPLVFESGQNAADQSPLDAVGLEQDQRSLHENLLF